jgi:1-phosphatidylinositol-3-phosphate 5-kinase
MAMEKYILQAPNCWHQFSGRMVGVGVPKRMPLLQGVEGIVDGKRRVEKGRGVEDEEKAS